MISTRSLSPRLLLRHSVGRWSALAQLLATLLVVIGATACGGDYTSATRAHASVYTEPSQVVFHPDTGPVAIDVVNSGDKPVPVSELRIEGPDQFAFSFATPIDGGVLRPGDRATLRVQVDPAAMRGPGEPIRGAVVEEHSSAPEVAADEYREGRANVTFKAGLGTVSVPLVFEDPHWASQYLVPAILKVLLLVMAFIMPLASLLTWMERKQSAMMQDRVGPNMARITIGGLTLRLWGLLHIATDGLKMLFKEDFIPRRAHRPLYNLAPLMAFIPALVVFAIVPFGDALCYGRLFDVVSQADVDQCAAGRGGTPLQIAQIDVGLLYYFAIASLATYGTTLAGWSSYNKWAVLGSLRASAQMISYEVAIGLTIVGALLVYGTLEPHALVKAQLVTHWGLALQPLAFVLFFTAAIAETKRAPFDLPEGESEIIGYFIEYSGMRFGLFYLGEFIEVVFVSALVTTLFLGGWSLPFGILGAHGFSSAFMAQAFFFGGGVVLCLTGAAIWRASRHGETFGSLLLIAGTAQIVLAVWSAFTGWGTNLPHVAVVAVGLVTWGLKVLGLCWLQLLIRWTLPRFRYDQLMSLGWKGLLPLSIANIVVTAVVVYMLAPSSAPQETAPPPTPAAQAAVPAPAKEPAP